MSYINNIATDAVNRNSLDVIERGQIVLCLDPSHPGVSVNSDERADALSVVSSRALHGNGTAASSCNRWFDHGIQVSILSVNAEILRYVIFMDFAVNTANVNIKSVKILCTGIVALIVLGYIYCSIFSSIMV